jgi:hypothetical protein
VVHAGLSQQLELVNLSLGLKDKRFFSQNNNLLIAQEAMEIMDVKEDGHQVLLTMLEIRVLPLNNNIHMSERINNVKLKVEVSRLQVFKAHQDVQELKVLFQEDQYQLQLMLRNGAAIDQEFSAIVELKSITLYLWLVCQAQEVSGKLKTLGELHGENKDTLDLNMETLVVFVIMLVSTHVDQYKAFIQSIIIILLKYIL